MKVWITEKSDDVCKNCANFRQHYICCGEDKYAPCNAGHCVYPRLKVREEYDFCAYFKEKPPEKG